MSREQGVFRVVGDGHLLARERLRVAALREEHLVGARFADREGALCGAVVERGALDAEAERLDPFAERMLARLVEREPHDRAERLARFGDVVGDRSDVALGKCLARDRAVLRLVERAGGIDFDCIGFREGHRGDRGVDLVAGILRLVEAQREALRSADGRHGRRIGEVHGHCAGYLDREVQRDLRDLLAETVFGNADAQQMDLVVECQRDGVAVVALDQRRGGRLLRADSVGYHDVPLAVERAVLHGRNLIGGLPGFGRCRCRDGRYGMIAVGARGIHGGNLAAEEGLLPRCAVAPEREDGALEGERSVAVPGPEGQPVVALPLDVGAVGEFRAGLYVDAGSGSDGDLDRLRLRDGSRFGRLVAGGRRQEYADQ